jgi:hypothetical protein
MMESRMKQDLMAQKIRTQKARTRVWKERARLAALAGALGLVALAGLAGGVAHAQSNESGLWGSMLKTLGIGDENTIEYHERPPLVVPPTRDLPPPQTTARARDPNWPVDPNSGAPQKKGAQVRDLDRLPVPQRAPATVATTPSGDATAAIPPSQPASSGGFFSNLFSSGDQSARPVVATAPAMRKTLTQPPLDYESPAPSQPAGVAPPPAAGTPATPESALQTQPGQARPGANGL